jgi:hypothetical protein
VREADLSRRIQLRASELGCRLFRQNVALAWVGELVSNRNGTVTLHNARPLHAGLCVGSSDLIGWSMDGLFVAIEIKLPGKNPTTAQAAFLKAVASAGGISGVARSVEDLERILATAPSRDP